VAAVEVDDLRRVGRIEAAGESDRRFLRDAEFELHARAGIDEQRERDGLRRPGKIRNVLLHAIFVDRKQRLLQAGDQHLALGHGDVE